VAIKCPYCDHPIELSGVRPGKFHPRCPKCHGKFTLRVHQDPNVPPQVMVEQESGSDATWTGRITAHSDPKQASSAGVKHTVAPVSPTTQASTGVKSSRSASMSGATVAPAASQVKSASVSGAKVVTNVTAVPSGESLFRTVAKQPRPDEPELHGRLGGYEIVQRLGQGGMGSVYLARQLSLDRTVAIKTLAPHLVQDPGFVARFTREAYAAAQLNHHNVVQIHDIGEETGTYFFSMEFVEGQNLGHLVESEGAVEPTTAVGYILQAARGLKFAHDHGMIHRDVKPENLMLNQQGIVKVADLGLVKRRGDKDITTAQIAQGAPQGEQHHTQVNTAMGTPAYIAPEQAIDAAKVDQRADIYSLGCTLYDLVCGRPPFSGRTADEVITKHIREPVTPPERIVKNLSPALSGIIQKMVAKRPEDRHQTMAELIKELESYLGVDGGNVRASSDRVKIVEYAAERFNAAPAAKLRKHAVVLFTILCAVGTAVCFFTGFHGIAGACLAFLVLSPLAYQVTVGARRGTTLFQRFRAWLFGAGIGDWLRVIVILGLTLGLLYAFNLLWIWLGVAVVATVAGVAFHFIFDAIVDKQRDKPLQDADKLIRELRVKGQDEDQIRGFIAKFSGDHWEAFYEALFGYDSKLWARTLYGIGERGKSRAKHAAWRDTAIRFFDNLIEKRKLAREAKLLAKLEAKAMVAKGIKQDVAAKQAKATANKLVSKATYVKETIAKQRIAETLAPTKAEKKPSAKMLEKLAQADEIKVEGVQAEEGLEGYEHQSYLKRRVGGPLDVIFGKMTRLALAAVVLAMFGLWWNQNYGARAKAEAQAITQTQMKSADQIVKEGGTKIAEAIGAATTGGANKPLAIPMVPEWITTAVGSWSGLAAGLILLACVLPEGKRMTIAAWVGAAICLFATGLITAYVPAVPETLRMPIAAGTGLIIGLGGIFMLRRIND
jgi:eukaryotic-like serine/threonine-protein kinase